MDKKEAVVANFRVSQYLQRGPEIIYRISYLGLMLPGLRADGMLLVLVLHHVNGVGKNSLRYSLI
jgi:hypothetical protein